MSLLEFLISILLFSIALLGLDAMEVFAMHKNLNIYYTSIAQRQVQNMQERLHMLSSKEGLIEQAYIWNKQNQEILPKGRGKIEGVYPRYIIELRWGEPGLNASNNKIGDRAGCIKKSIIVTTKESP